MKTSFFKVCLAALLAVFSLSSCLESNDDGTRSNYGFFKPVSLMGYSYYVDASGFKYVPTTTSSTSTTTPSYASDLVLLQYSYNVNNLTMESTSVDITLLASPYYVRALEYVSEAETEDNKALSIYNIEGLGLWGTDYLILPISTRVHKSTTNDTFETEAANHHFELYMDEEGSSDNQNVLRLKLRYTIDDVTADDEDKLKEYTTYYSDYMSCDIRRAVYDYQVLNGGDYPEKIEVSYQMSQAGAVTGADKGIKSSVSVRYPKKDETTDQQ